MSAAPPKNTEDNAVPSPTRFCALLCALLLATAAQAYEPRLTFAADATAARAAARYAGDMVRFAQLELAVALDLSDASIAQIEQLAGALQTDLWRERGSYSEIEALVQMLGCYVGEVYRRNHGGEWGYVDVQGRRLMALKARVDGRLLWPVERIRQRLHSHANNILAYYRRNTPPTAP